MTGSLSLNTDSNTADLQTETLPAIAPGFIETELARRIAGQEPDPEAALRARRAMHAIPRAGQPEEIGAAAAYLASDAAAFMTGQCLTLDGGYTVR